MPSNEEHLMDSTNPNVVEWLQRLQNWGLQLSRDGDYVVVGQPGHSDCFLLRTFKELDVVTSALYAYRNLA